jgi:NADPH2:quinone reductase
MKAIQVSAFGDPSVLHLADLPTPTPGPHQLLIKVHAAGVNPVDTYVRSGTYPALPKLPYTPGSDGAGVVIAAGSDAKRFAVNQRVYFGRAATGSYAEFAVVDEQFVGPLPEGKTYEDGAALYVPYFTAYQALFVRAQVRRGEAVLIHGATGCVGQAAIQWLAQSKFKILATGGSERGRDLVRTMGAHAVFDHAAPGYLDQIRAAAPTGIDVILEMLANVNLGHDLPLLALHGRVVVIGNRGEVTINPRALMAKDADIRGMTLFNITPAQLARTHHAVLTGLTAGYLTPTIAQRLPLDEAAKAHELVLAPGACGKIILLP